MKRLSGYQVFAALAMMAMGVFGIYRTQQSRKFRDITTTQFSNVMIEPAEVVEVVFTPPTRHSVDLMGSVLSLQSIDIPEQYSVVFKCGHGAFIIESSSLMFQELVSKFKDLAVGDNVIVSYREVYEVLSTDHDRDGVRESFVSLVDYDFISARKRFAIEKE